MQTYAQPDVVIRASAVVGEGPVFDQRTGRLCWVDIESGLLFENDLVTGDQTRTAVDTMVAAAVPRITEKGFAVAIREGFGFIVDGELQITDVVLPEPERRMNDAKCDSFGRLWAGSTRFDFAPGGGALHLWDGHSSHVVADGFALPNGIGWSPDDTTMYFIDSAEHVLYRTAFNAGEIDEFEPLVHFESSVMPDGLVVDGDGCIWVAVWGGAEVRRFSAAGELIGRIPMPVDQPSSCAFGDDGTLYITSATSKLSQTQLARQPLAGSVFALATDTRGVPVHPFAG